MIDCDVLVVGAGPSGSSAARAAALNGLNVVLIEKNEKPGKIACGEAVASFLLPFLPFKIPENQFIWKTTGMSFDTEGIHLERYGKLWEAYSISRIEFDNWLAKEAEKSGVKFYNNSELKGLDHQNYNIEKAYAKQGKKDIEIKPKCIIAADGTESTVLKLLNLYNPKENDFAEIYSFEYDNVDISNTNVEQIFLGYYVDGGYGYIFPKSKNKINIGIGSIFPQINLEKSFEEFCELPQVKKQIKNGKQIKEKSGKAPIIPFLEKNYYENVLLTGDAACQNFKPYAEGILPGVICGDICGRSASLFLKKSIPLTSYEKKIDKKLGFMFKESDKITDTIYDLFLMKDIKRFSILAAYASNLAQYKEIEKLKTFENKEIKNIIDKRYKNQFSTKVNETLQFLYIKIKGMAGQ